MTTWDLDFEFATADAAGIFKLEVCAKWQARVTGIFGPSGSGKTTLIEVLLGIRPRRGLSGAAAINGFTLFDTERDAWLRPEKRHLSWVPQEGGLFPHLTVRGNLRLAASGSSDAEVRIVRLLDLEPLMARLPAALSGGERQRVALGRALLTNHRALLLDEPTASLDLNRRRDLLELISDVANDVNVPILYVSHAHSEITRLCEYALIIDGGRLIAHGRPEDVLPPEPSNP